VQTTLQGISGLVPKLLGDLDEALWGLAQTRPFINSALREFHQNLRDLGVKQINYRTTYASLPANTTSIAVGSGGANDLPATLIEPLTMWEADVGTSGLQNFTRMWGPGRLPNRQVTGMLGFWDWRGGAIALLGANVARQLMLDYQGALTDLLNLSDSVQTPDAIEPVAYLTAAKIANAQGNTPWANSFMQQGMMGIERIANADIRTQQSAPVRRQPRLGGYRYPLYR